MGDTLSLCGMFNTCFAMSWYAAALNTNIYIIYICSIHQNIIHLRVLSP